MVMEALPTPGMIQSRVKTYRNPHIIFSLLFVPPEVTAEWRLA
jgi:hypothetical protein